MDDGLVDENMFVVTAKPDWYVGIVEFLTTQELPDDWTKEKRRKVKANSRYFTVVGHKLFRKGGDGFIKRYVSKVEAFSILDVSYDSACGGYFSSQYTGQFFP